MGAFQAAADELQRQRTGDDAAGASSNGDVPAGEAMVVDAALDVTPEASNDVMPRMLQPTTVCSTKRPLSAQRCCCNHVP
jgi:hypothetical protein